MATHRQVLMNNMYRHSAPKVKLLPEDFLEKAFSEYLACHPTYMIPLIRAHNFIMRDLGPLNPVFRHYIAILAASRHRCSYLVNLSKKEFLYNGGDPEWIKNFEKAPSKLRALHTINKVLAHQPWLFNKSHIEALTKGPYPWTLSELTHAIIIMAHFHALCSLSFGCKFGSDDPENFEEEEGDYEEVEIEELCYDANGSQKIKKIVKRSPASKLIIERCRQLELENANLAEIMSIRFNERYARAKGNRGKGNNNNNKNGKQKNGENDNNSKTVDSANGNEEGKKNNNKNNGNKNGNNPSTSSASSSSQPTSNKKKIASSSGDSTKSLSTSPSASSTSSTSSNSSTTSQELTVKEKTVQSKISTIGPIGGVLPGADKKEGADAVPFVPNTWSEDMWKKNAYDGVVEDPAFGYVDFASRGRPSEVSTFRIQDYQWDDQGYSLCNLFYPDVSQFLDEKFKVGYNLTYFTLGPKTNIDTSPFRRAIWNYIQCVYGMRHDDYNYREVNILLERHLKLYIKSLACFPDRVPKQDFSSVMQGFRASEKIHVIIMVSEARLQTELLYALRTLTEFMKQTA